MKVSQAIGRARALCPSVYDDDVLAGWLSELDGKLAAELFHEEPREAYRLPGDGETELLAEHPYDNLYELYLLAMMDFSDREMERYANDMELFNAAMGEFRRWWRRGHLPPQSGNYKIF